MKTRQPQNHYDEIQVRYGGRKPEYAGHWIVVRFQPHQRKEAKEAFILRAFLMGWMPHFNHWAFAMIDQRTWEPVEGGA
jgi:hypothetical protein